MPRSRAPGPSSWLVALALLAGCATAPAARPAVEARAPAPATPAAPPPDPLRVAAHRDRAGLAPLLAGGGSTRAAAVLGLGRLQDPADGAELARALLDPLPAERVAAAEALGLLGLAWDEPTDAQRLAMTGALAAAAGTEADPAVRERIAWAIGRTGGSGAAAALAVLLRDAAPAVRAQAAFSAGVTGRFHAPSDPATLSSEVLRLAGDPDPQVRAAAAFASIYLPAADASVLGSLLADRDAQVRAFAARAYGVAGGDPARLANLASDPEPRVRVEAVRGLEVLASKKNRAAARALESMARTFAAGERREPGPANAQPLELLVRPTVGETSAQVARAALAGLGDPHTAARGADAARLRCLAAAAADRASRKLREVPGCGAGLVPHALEERLEASVLAVVPSGAARLAVLSGPGHEPAVRMEALDALGKTPGAGADAIVAALTDVDPAVVSSAAGAIAARKETALRPALIEALARTSGVSATESAQAILDALGTLGDDATAREAAGKALSDPRSAVRTSARKALVAMGAPPEQGPGAIPELEIPATTGSPLRHARVETERGSFTIELDDAAAPVTAASFRNLVRLGFFDGLIFHRVEPGFVVQGGDPRGDGSGGPGFAIPCENAATPYERGTVGMALSGKDTGGSQWFVTYGRTPHLEGRYTAFGRVVAGMDVVESLLAGDRMGKVTLEP